MPSPTDRRPSRTTRTRRLTMSAMFACLALIFTYVEVLIPYSVGIPGVKLGLANLVILIALYEMDARYALTINLIRICLSGLLFSGLFAMLYSLAGGVLSVASMLLLYRVKGISAIGVSAVGAVFFNVGQIMMAVLMLRTPGLLFTYLPVLMVSGVITGVLTGVVAQMVMQHLRVLNKQIK